MYYYMYLLFLPFFFVRIFSIYSNFPFPIYLKPDQTRCRSLSFFFLFFMQITLLHANHHSAQLSLPLPLNTKSHISRTPSNINSKSTINRHDPILTPDVPIAQIFACEVDFNNLALTGFELDFFKLS
jgi:hypothetical protein